MTIDHLLALHLQKDWLRTYCVAVGVILFWISWLPIEPVGSQKDTCFVMIAWHFWCFLHVYVYFAALLPVSFQRESVKQITSQREPRLSNNSPRRGIAGSAR